MSANRRAVLAVAGLGALIAAAPAGAATPKSKTAPAAKPALRIDPRELGAKADGVTKDTQAVQLALDRCAVFGGGEVGLRAGPYLVGAIRIGSNTTLRIEDGAPLQGSPDLADYPIVQ